MILKLGDKSPKVKELQELLHQQGYYNKRIDDIFGQGTKDAVKKYQTDNNIKPFDGIVGDKTAAHLGLQLGLKPTTDFSLSETSLKRLSEINPILQKIVKRAIQLSNIQFQVGEGMRTLERQKVLIKQGATQTLNSRHLTGHAVDLIAYPNGVVSWDWKYYYMIEEAMKQAAKELNIEGLEWGGDWKSFKDGPHYQLSWAKYPK
ncbi:hypothetical protein SHAb15599_00194 [Acinetobacter phage SH-Ab 15599]|nr:hypothetical protein SHAb15599_00194 [Acinetobacter phage SH-Ab 15599]